jgi:hypothetical protein
MIFCSLSILNGVFHHLTIDQSHQTSIADTAPFLKEIAIADYYEVDASMYVESTSVKGGSIHISDIHEVPHPEADRTRWPTVESTLLDNRTNF